MFNLLKKFFKKNNREQERLELDAFFEKIMFEHSNPTHPTPEDKLRARMKKWATS